MDRVSDRLTVKTDIGEAFANYPYWEVSLSNEIALSPMDPDVASIMSVFREKAYALLESGSEEVTSANEMGKGAQCFKSLKECGCTLLARSETNLSRMHFENIVIKEALKIVVEEKTVVLKVAAFGTGFLFGESVILAKMIHGLKNYKSLKKIEFNCIDHYYESISPEAKGIVEKNVDALSIRQDLAGAIPEFINLVEKTIALVKPTFNVTLRFFSQMNQFFQFSLIKDSTTDLLISADRAQGSTDEVIDSARSVINPTTYISLERTRGYGESERPIVWINDDEHKFGGI